MSAGGTFLTHEGARDMVEIHIGDGTTSIICVPCRCSLGAPPKARPAPAPRPPKTRVEKPPKTRPAPAPRPTVTAVPKPGKKVKPQTPVEKPVTKTKKVRTPKVKKTRTTRQQRAAARPIPVVAVASVLVVFVVLGHLDALGAALSALVASVVAAVLYALLVAGLTVAALAAGYANGRWLIPAVGRRVVEHVEHRRDLAALREIVAEDIRRERPAWASREPIALGPVVEPVATPVESVLPHEQAEIERAWMPGTLTPEPAYAWQYREESRRR